MAVYVNGKIIPKIDWDEGKCVVYTHTTREEKIERLERNFRKTYKKEMEANLPSGAKGIVVVQMGHYPFDMEIKINPKPSDRCEKMVMEMSRSLRQEYVFVSRTYLLEDEKLTSLINSESVLNLSASREAMIKMVSFYKDWLRVDYLGVELIKFGRVENPYRVWEVKPKDGERFFVCFSLLNGAVFIVPEEEMPQRRPAENHFIVGAIRFVRDRFGKKGDFMRL